MSDLISRSALIEILEDYENDDWNKNISAMLPSVVDDCIDFIENMPKAYDIGKVVAELEKIRAKKTCNKEKCDTKEICRICVVDDAIEIVKQVAEEYNGGWIPVKTRPMTEEEKEIYAEFDYGFIYDCKLPDDSQEVLITSKYGSVQKVTFYTDCGSYFEGYEDYDEVIAWMPLPEIYKERD